MASLLNRSARKVPKKNYFDLNPAKLAARAGTSGLVIQGSKMFFTNNSVDYGGYQQTLDDRTFQGKYVTISYLDKHPGVTVMLAYSVNGSPVYNSATNGANSYRTVFVPFNATAVRFYAQNEAGQRGDFWVDGMQLELTNNVRTAYEPYIEINRDAVKVPKKNMLPPFSDVGWTYPAGNVFTILGPHSIRGSFTAGLAQYPKIIIPVKPGGTYTASFTGDGASVRMRIGKGSDDSLLQNTFNNNSVTFTVPANEKTISVRFDNNNTGGTWTGGVFDFIDAQLEEGSARTAPELYQLINKAAKLVPKKNLLKPLSQSLRPGGLASGFTVLGDYKIQILTATQFGNKTVRADVRPGVTYTFSAAHDGKITIQFKDSAGAQISSVNWTAAQKVTFTTPANCYFIDAALEISAQNVLTTFDNLQLEEGSAQTSFSPYSEVTRPKAATLPKAAKKNYPFTFERYSQEIQDGILYGVNIPRIKDGGLLIEEGTTNLWIGENTYLNGHTGVKDGDWYKVTNNSGGTGTAGFRIWVPIASLVDGQTYTASCTVYNPNDYAVTIHQDWTDISGTSFDAVIQPKETKRISVTGTKADYDNTYRFYDLAVYGNGNTAWFKDIQVENKSYPTSCSQGTRQPEAITFPASVCDNVGGEIEITFKTPSNFASRNGSPNQAIIDATASGIVPRLFIMSNGSNFSAQAAGALLANAAAVLPDTIYKVRIVWGSGSQSWYLNDVLMNSSSFTASANPGTVYVGCDAAKSRQSLITFYSFKVKDRNGNIVFQF